METVTYNIPSISCSACSAKIQNSLKNMKGVEDVSVDLKTQSITVKYSEDAIHPQDIKRSIASMGYDILQ